MVGAGTTSSKEVLYRKGKKKLGLSRKTCPCFDHPTWQQQFTQRCPFGCASSEKVVGCGGGGGGFVLGLEKRGRAVLLGKEERGEGKDAVEAAAERWLEREGGERPEMDDEVCGRSFL